MKSVMDCHGIEVEEMGGSVRHEQVDICPHKSWHLEGDCELTEDHVAERPEPISVRKLIRDGETPLFYEGEPLTSEEQYDQILSEEARKLEQTKSTNPKDILARDEQRVLLHLLPSPGLIHTALAMMDGARKYGPYNWRDEGVGAGTYVSAAMRHLRDWLDGEEDAPDSGVHHLGHAAACVLILLDAQAVGNLVDDRPAPAPTSEMMEEVKATGGVDSEEEDPAAGLPPYTPEAAIKEDLREEMQRADVPREDRV